MYQKSESGTTGYARQSRTDPIIPPTTRKHESVRPPWIDARNLHPDEVVRKIQDGYRLVRYPYSLSFLLVTLNRNSGPYLLDRNHSGFLLRVGHAGISFVFGWWALPLGPVFTLASIIKSLSGGTDETQTFLVSRSASTGSDPLLPPPIPGPRSGHALASLLLAMVSLAGPGLFLGIPAVIIGHIALSRIRSNPGTSGRGMALTGLILGYLSIAVNILIVLFVAITAFSEA